MFRPRLSPTARFFRLVTIVNLGNPTYRSPKVTNEIYSASPLDILLGQSILLAFATRVLQPIWKQPSVQGIPPSQNLAGKVREERSEVS
jgi:hypothetical protein